MRISVVHGYYSSRQPSGENVVVDHQVRALREAGHDVAAFAVRQDVVEQRPLYPLGAAWRAATGLGPAPVERLDAFEPDVVHVHNLFPNIGRRWVESYADRLVATLHNFRPLCPAATLERDGAPCRLCPSSGSAHHAVLHACYRGSRVQSVPVALGTRFARDPLLASARRLVVLNQDMVHEYAAVGVPAQRLRVVPNSVPEPQQQGTHEGGFWLFVGRLVAEKGVLDLVRTWPPGRRLVVVGDGPLHDEVRRSAGPDVEVLGHRSAAEVQRLLGEARGLCFASTWREGLPTVYLEALAAGVPVLAFPGSVVADLVAEQGTGHVVQGSLSTALDSADAAFDGLRATCRAVHRRRYTTASWVSAIEEVYADVTDLSPP